jgi:catechol 2,3-dioxygenase-like lactoylglutathione lyase family enzyme
MWVKLPFTIADGYAVDVSDLRAAREWYKEKLGLQESREKREDDSGRPCADLVAAGDDGMISLVELEAGAAGGKGKVLLFAKNLEKARDWLSGRGVAVGPVTTEESSGTRLFRFPDLDGNTIEICVEP